ncbi:MAG: deoxyribose-phosphate aldolase [Cyanobacteria bacterium P01_C01_bin.89]
MTDPSFADYSSDDSIQIDLEQVDIASAIEHAMLHPAATEEHLEMWCGQAERYGFATVCIMPWHVQKAATLLQGKSPQVCAVIGFPSGATTSAAKIFEAQEAIANGARELDVMINLGQLKMGQSDTIYRELGEICEAAEGGVKAILEMNLLDPDEIQLAVEIALDAGVSFLKTHTGWQGGVTVDQVRMLKELGRDRIGIKAAGGIHNPYEAAALLLAGATRLGTSRGPDFVARRSQITLEPAEEQT